MDVVKERLQVQIQFPLGTEPHTIKNPPVGLPLYNGSLDALIQICKNEGLKGIYKGYGATLLTYGPFSALYFFLYEEVIGCILVMVFFVDIFAYLSIFIFVFHCYHNDKITLLRECYFAQNKIDLSIKCRTLCLYK